MQYFGTPIVNCLFNYELIQSVLSLDDDEAYLEQVGERLPQWCYAGLHCMNVIANGSLFMFNN